MLLIIQVIFFMSFCFRISDLVTVVNTFNILLLYRVRQKFEMMATFCFLLSFSKKAGPGQF
jgi:hypothetical protein